MLYFSWNIFPLNRPDIKDHPLLVDVSPALERNGYDRYITIFVNKVIDPWEAQKIDQTQGAGEFVDCPVSHHDIKVISERAKILFDEFMLEYVQYLPIDIFIKKYNKYMRFYILNIFNYVEYMDLQKTPHEIDEEGEIDLTRWNSPIWIKYSAIQNEKLFHIKKMSTGNRC
jgi:hypothetical protein